MNDLEIIINLWYVYDDLGLIYSLRARTYIRSGSEEEKLKYLQEHALTDYLIAKPFSIPEPYHNIIDGVKTPVFPVKLFNVFNYRMELFEDAIIELEKDLPIQTKYSIPKEPLVCITPLKGDDSGNIFPNFSEKNKL